MDAMEKAELITEKEELEQRLEKIRKDLATGLSADFEEQAVELENRDVLLEIARVSEEQLEILTKKLQQANE
jgi:aspartate/tyrosine/aromatic aminotransferase